MYETITMKITLFLFMFFCSFGVIASSENNLRLLEANLFKDWIYATNVQEINSPNISITRPVGVELLILRLSFEESRGNNYVHHCVYYRVPFKKINGKIIITENKDSERCDETPSGKVNYELDGLQNFIYSLNSYELKMSFTFSKKNYNWLFPLNNLQIKSEHNRFKSESKKMRLPGLTLLRIDDHPKGPNLFSLGNLDDSFSAGTAIRCYKVNKDCIEIGENLCNRCRFGFYEVVDYTCPNGGSKFCGVNHCGKKSQPACPRGTKTRDQEIDGICEESLKPVANSENILICQ